MKEIESVNSRNFAEDQRVVLTLDAGGTKFAFSALQGHRAIVPEFTMPSNGYDLQRCLATIIEGFAQIKKNCPYPPVAISFAFPGPADYPNGIIHDLHNLPGFRGGIALGAMLEEAFGIPVFINNDGDLFAFGEAVAGLLPYVNDLFEKAGSPKRFKNLLGVTLGTGFGGGIVRNGEIYIGDNSVAGEISFLRNKLEPSMNAEEGACIRAVRRVYAEHAGIKVEQAPEPKDIFEIASGNAEGNKTAAYEAFRRLGEVAGDAIANALTLLDGLVVIGGGISGAWRFYLPVLCEELNSHFTGPGGESYRRLHASAYNLDDPVQLERFIKGKAREITVPFSTRKISYDPLMRVGVGLSRMRTSEAIAVGAYVFALRKLDKLIE